VSAGFFSPSLIRPIELGVVTELARPVYRRVELLLTVVIAVPTIRFEEVASAVRQGYAAVMAVERECANQALVDQVLQAVVPAIESVIIP